MASTKKLWIAYTRIFFVELAYWVVSISLVFVNEHILNPKLLPDDLTIFVTIFQICFSLCILITLNYLTKHYLYPYNENSNESKQPKQKELVTVKTKLMDADELDKANPEEQNYNESNDTEFEHKSGNTGSLNIDPDSLINLLIVNIPHRINLGTCKLVFPLSVLYIGMLLLNNFCLKYVGVPFYFVSRSLTTVFNVAFTYFLIGEPISHGSLICCALIILGFILGIDQENVLGSLSVIGVVFGVTSSLFTSLFSIYTKKTLAKLDRNIWVLVLYNNINAIAICTPLLLVHGDIQALISDNVISPQFWIPLSISGVIAFLISIVTNASIKYTSPLTHNISGTAKACLQTVIAVIYKQDHKSLLWWISNLTILIASAVYSRIRQLEMEQKSSSLPTVAKRRNFDQLDELQNEGLKLQRRDSSSSGSSATSDEVILHQRNDTYSVNFKNIKEETA